MKKTLTTLIVSIFFASNVVFLHADESNFWKERKQARQNPTLLASLPSPLLSPKATAPNPNLGPSYELSKDLKSKISVPQIPSHYRLYLESIPLNAGSVKDIHLSKKALLKTARLFSLFKTFIKIMKPKRMFLKFFNRSHKRKWSFTLSLL